LISVLRAILRVALRAELVLAMNLSLTTGAVSGISPPKRPFFEKK
jgi:hypothetical protein